MNETKRANSASPEPFAGNSQITTIPDQPVITALLTNDATAFEALIQLWREQEACRGTMLKCKGAEVDKVNPIGLAAFLAKATGIVFEPQEKTLWLKDSPRALWCLLDEDELATRLLEALTTFIRKAFCKSFEFIAKQSLANEIVRRLKHFAARPGFFDTPPGTYILHCMNCFLVYNAETEQFEKRPLADENIHSRHQLPMIFDPAATCQRFENELLAPITTEDERRVLYEYIGQIFLGKNLSQKVLFFTGAAGGGKSTIVNIIEMLLGRENVAELRTNALHGWYETHRYLGKSLLVGKDVPADFMRHHGASKIKALTGNDLVSTEKKHSNEVSTFAGTLNVIITSNCNQPIMLQDDRDAWERRVLSIKCKAPEAPVKPIRDFDKIIVDSEASGILNLALAGLTRIIRAGGTIEASEEQRREIADLLDESEGVPVFLREKVEMGERDQNLTSWELYVAYKEYCKSRGWTPKSQSIVQKELPDFMAAVFSVPRRTDVVRDGTNHRGYWGVRLAGASKL